MIMEWGIGDVVTMRKPHPCGSYKWRVSRLGADIGIRCIQCGRRVLAGAARPGEAGQEHGESRRGRRLGAAITLPFLRKQTSANLRCIS